MERKNKLALVVGYFLARFNVRAYEELGFGTQLATHQKVGKILNVNPHSVKNMRDEFDPLFEHRAGWYQRPMSPSRQTVVDMMSNYSFDQVNSIVNEILSKGADGKYLTDLTEAVLSDEDQSRENLQYGSRALTGKKAEELFELHYKKIIPSFDGDLINTTLEGTGFDFKNSMDTIYVEVKGSASVHKGVLLTEKEWEAAKKYKEKYFLILIYLLDDNPEYVVIQNPRNVLNPTLSIVKTITLNWNVKSSEMNDIAEKKARILST